MNRLRQSHLIVESKANKKLLHYIKYANYALLNSQNSYKKQSPLRMKMVLRPGFEPGSTAREAVILDRTILPELGILRISYHGQALLIRIAI
jgi:hypothetical protein